MPAPSTTWTSSASPRGSRTCRECPRACSSRGWTRRGSRRRRAASASAACSAASTRWRGRAASGCSAGRRRLPPAHRGRPTASRVVVRGLPPDCRKPPSRPLPAAKRRAPSVVSPEAMTSRPRLNCARAPSQLLAPDPDRGAELAQHGDRREIGELAGPRVLGGHVLDLDPEAAELALDGDAVLVLVQPRDGKELDACPLGAETGEGERRDHVDVGGERLDGLAGGALEDQGLFADRVEVDALLRDVGRAGEPTGRLAGLHGDRGDRTLPRPLHPVESGDGTGGNEDPRAMLL